LNEHGEERTEELEEVWRNVKTLDKKLQREMGNTGETVERGNEK
jgi:ribosomal protein L32E